MSPTWGSAPRGPVWHTPTFRRVITPGVAGVVVSFAACVPTYNAFGVAYGLVVWAVAAPVIPVLVLRRMARPVPSLAGGSNDAPADHVATERSPRATLLKAWAVTLVGSGLALTAVVMIVLNRLSESCYQHGGC